MRMRSLVGETYIALLDGSSIVIGDAYRDVPIKFRREALMLLETELEIEGIKKEDVIQETAPAHSPELHLVNVIKVMREEEEKDPNCDNFTNSGLPNLNKLRSKAGYNVSKDEMLIAWELSNR